MKKGRCMILALIVVILVSAFSCSSASTADLIKVGIICPIPEGSELRKEYYDNILATFTQDNGYEPLLVEASTAEEQQAAIESLLEQDVAYLLICPVETTGWKKVKAMQKVSKAGIKTFFVGAMVDCDPKLYTAAVLSSHYAEGQAAVDWLESLKLKKYNVLLLTGSPEDEVQAEHLAAVKTKKWKIVYEASGNGNREQAQELVEAYIEKGKSFNIIIAANDEMAQGAADALDARGLVHGYFGEKDIKGIVYIVSFSSNQWAVKKLKPDLNETWGEWNYIGICDPHQDKQITAVEKMIKTLEAGNEIEGLNKKKQYFAETKWFDAQSITTEDIDQFGK